MAHPTFEIRDLKRRLDAQEAELAALRSRLPPEPEKPVGPVLPQGAEVHFDGFVYQGGQKIGRMVAGEFAPFPSEAEQEAAHQARIVAARIEREEAAAAEKSASYFIDPSGFRRGMGDGLVIGRDSVLRAAEAAAAAEAAEA